MGKRHSRVARFLGWTCFTFILGFLAGGAGKAALDTLASRVGWHFGGEVLVLGSLVLLPLVWLHGAGFRVEDLRYRLRKLLDSILSGGCITWK